MGTSSQLFLQKHMCEIKAMTLDVMQCKHCDDGAKRCCSNYCTARDFKNESYMFCTEKDKAKVSS